MLGAAPLPDIEEDILLPREEEQTWLLEQLGRVIDARGYETFVNAPMLEPTEVFFPDRWAGGEASMRRLALRLLRYAGLMEHTVQVKVYDEDDDNREQDGKPLPLAGEDVDVWFTGFARDERGNLMCCLGAEASALPDAFGIVAATARAIAVAFRAHHKVQVAHRATEERLVDLTTVYLGFGILTAEASRRHLSSADGNFRSKRKIKRLGVLPPQAMCYLLGVQARVRGLDRKGHRHIAKRLQNNQRAFFRRALEVVRDEDAAREKLSIPDIDEWPDLPSMRSLVPSIDDDPAAQDDPEVVEEAKGVDKGVVDKNVGKPVFRVERRASLRVAKLLALPVVMIGGLVARGGFQGFELPMWQVIVVAASLGLFGLLLGWMLTDSRCSEPKCGQALTAEMETCPRCGGTVVGVIGHPKERLAAEEALAQQERDALLAASVGDPSDAEPDEENAD